MKKITSKEGLNLLYSKINSRALEREFTFINLKNNVRVTINDCYETILTDLDKLEKLENHKNKFIIPKNFVKNSKNLYDNIEFTNYKAIISLLKITLNYILEKDISLDEIKNLSNKALYLLEKMLERSEFREEN